MHDERPFDPRAWNLFAGVALIVGCGDRTIADDGETDTTGDGDDYGDGDGYADFYDDGYYNGCNYDPCTSDAACSNCGSYGPWVCNNGSCVPDYDCAWDYWCSQFEQCIDQQCVSQGTPPPSCGFGEFDIPTVLEPPGGPLALSFADVDADGSDELVVATTTELLVYESGSDVPTASPRMPPSSNTTKMVAGQFDTQPGEDVTLLDAGEYHRYFSDSIAGLGMPSIEASSLTNPSGLFAAEFDGTAPSDLLVWGESGAMLELGGTTVPLAMESVSGGAGFDHGSPAEGMTILRLNYPRGFDWMGTEQFASGQWSSTIANMWADTQPFYFTVGEYESDYHSTSWCEIAVLDAPSLDVMRTIVLPGGMESPTNEGGYVAGDFDGDQYDEILASQGSPNLRIVFGVFTQPCLATQNLGGGEVALDLAVGDHDGDGDDEVAMIQGANVIVVDVE